MFGDKIYMVADIVTDSLCSAVSGVLYPENGIISLRWDLHGKY